MSYFIEKVIHKISSKSTCLNFPRTFLQSIFKNRMSEFEKAKSQRSVRKREFQNEEGYKNEKFLVYTRKRSGYVSQLTKLINKIKECLKSNKHSKLDNYNDQLDNIIVKIRNVTTKLNALASDNFVSEQVLQFCTEQELRVFEIKKAIQFQIDFPPKIHLSKSSIPKKAFSDPKPKSIERDKTINKSILSLPNSADLEGTVYQREVLPFIQNRQINHNVKTKSHSSKSKESVSVSSKSQSNKSKTSCDYIEKSLSIESKSTKSKSSSSTSSKSSKVSYLSLSERRRTVEQAKLIAKQAEDRAQMKIKLLEQTFELKKEKLREEAFLARQNATAVEFENYINQTLKLDNNIDTSNNCKNKVVHSTINHRNKTFTISSLNDKETNQIELEYKESKHSQSEHSESEFSESDFLGRSCSSTSEINYHQTQPITNKITHRINSKSHKLNKSHQTKFTHQKQSINKNENNSELENNNSININDSKIKESKFNQNKLKQNKTKREPVDKFIDDLAKRNRNNIATVEI